MEKKPIILTPEQLSAWRNNDARKAWLDAHRAWPRISGTPEIGVEWFVYELPDGHRIVAMTQPSSYKSDCYSKRFCWQYKGDKYPNVMCAASVPEICDHLKNLKAQAAKGGC